MEITDRYLWGEPSPANGEPACYLTMFYNPRKCKKKRRKGELKVLNRQPGLFQLINTVGLKLGPNPHWNWGERVRARKGLTGPIVSRVVQENWLLFLSRTSLSLSSSIFKGRRVGHPSSQLTSLFIWNLEHPQWKEKLQHLSLGSK